MKHRFNDPNRLFRYNRRKRKKHHIGEFQECIFSVKASFNPPLIHEDYDVFIDAFFDLADERLLDVWVEVCHVVQNPLGDVEAALLVGKGYACELQPCVVGSSCELQAVQTFCEGLEPLLVLDLCVRECGGLESALRR